MRLYDAFRAVQHASVRGYVYALEAVAREVGAMFATDVTCASIDDPELVVGAVCPERVRDQALRADWGSGPVVLRGEGVTTCVPIFAQLPGSGELAQRFPIAVLLIAGEHAELGGAVELAELVGDTLLIARDHVSDHAPHGTTSARAFRRLTRRWIEVARGGAVAVSAIAVAVDGLEGINRMMGFDAGDGALHRAVTFLVREVPRATAVSVLGGACTALLLVGASAEEARAIADHVLAAFAREEEDIERQSGRVSLTAGIATFGPDVPDGDLVRAARSALAAARKQRAPVAVWTPALAITDPLDLPDIETVSNADYQRILAIWRLFEVMCHGAQLDQLIAATLRALLPLFRGERAALWQQQAGTWVRSTSIELGAGGELAPQITAELAAQIAEAAASRTVVSSHTERGHTIAIGLRRGDEVTGVLEVGHHRKRLITDEHHLGFLRTFARQIGHVIGEVQALSDARRQQQESADRLRRQTIELRRLVRTSSGMVGNDASMLAVFKMIERARASNVPVIITGETGTGKEAAARLIHRMANRHAPFVVVDCGAIPDSLLESELFGHEKGAFTSAVGRKIGRFEEADEGTIFLDEIGEMPLQLQPKLLRVLQERTIRRLGGRETISVNFRLIAATHRNLAQMVDEGRFRQDLYFRLRVLEINLPPLRDRGDDILLLALHSLRQYCLEIGRDIMTISPDAEALMRTYPWPGNVRELQNVLRRAVLVAPGAELSAKDLHLEPQQRSQSRRFEPISEPASEPEAPEQPATELDDAVSQWFWHAWAPQAPAVPPHEAIEAFLLRTCLRVSEGSIGNAAKRLAMHPETFGSHLEKLGDPEMSRTIRHHRLGSILEATVLDASDGELRDRILRILLIELLVYCRGNKSDMARHLGWGRQTLTRQLKRLHVTGAESRNRR